MKFLPVPMAAILLAGCAASGSYPTLQIRPGETPRTIPAPDATAAPELSAAARDSLRADLAQAEQALQTAQGQLQDAGRALQTALAVNGVSTPGSDAWSNAQVALSQFQDSRGQLVAVDARLAPLQMQVDGLPADDPDVRRLGDLERRLGKISANAQTRMQSANARLQN
jgi:hypothetical protein